MYALKLPSHSVAQGLCPLQTPSLQRCRAPRAFGARTAGVRCRAAAQCCAAEVERRSVLVGLSTGALVALQQPARADEGTTSSLHMSKGILCCHTASIRLLCCKGAGVTWRLSHAEPGAMQVFYGLAAPPTSYGGYGGNAKEAAKCASSVHVRELISLSPVVAGLMLVLAPCRYTFEYPTGWKIDTIGKVTFEVLDCVAHVLLILLQLKTFVRVQSLYMQHSLV